MSQGCPQLNAAPGIHSGVEFTDDPGPRQLKSPDLLLLARLVFG